MLLIGVPLVESNFASGAVLAGLWRSWETIRHRTSQALWKKGNTVPLNPQFIHGARLNVGLGPALFPSEADLAVACQ